KENSTFLGNVERRVSCDERVCLDAGGRIVLPGNIYAAHDELGKNDLEWHLGREVRTWLETRESAACPNPDGAVGLFGERVEVAIVPSQPVAHIVVAPSRPIPHVYAPLRAHPQPPHGVEFEEIHQSIRAGSLNGFLNDQTTGL